jgi:predicted nucleic acid-binding protein
LSVYLDTSVLVSLFVRDGRTDRVLNWAQTQTEPPQVSDWAVTEFSSALGLRRRLGQLEEADRANLELALDGWLQTVSRVEVGSADLALARHLMRSELIALKAPDAFHLALSLRWGSVLATTDRQLAQAAVDLGLQVEDL